MRYKKINWDDVTLKKFVELQKYADLPTEEANFEMIKCLYGNEVENLPLCEFAELVQGLGGLDKIDVERRAVGHYVLSGRKYYFASNPEKMTTAQYMDYQALLSESVTPARFREFIAVFLVPDGHKYNDGYDVDVVRNDADELPIVEVLRLMHFFAKVLRKSLKRLKDYSLHATREREREREELETLWQSMEYYLTFLGL